MKIIKGWDGQSDQGMNVLLNYFNICLKISCHPSPLKTKSNGDLHEDISREKHNWNFVLKLMKWKHSQYTELVHKCVGKTEMSAFEQHNKINAHNSTSN